MYHRRIRNSHQLSSAGLWCSLLCLKNVLNVLTSVFLSVILTVFRIPTFSRPLVVNSSERCGLLLVLLISFGSSQFLAAQDIWDCQLGDDGKEWVCATKEKEFEPEPKTKTPVDSQKTIAQQSPPQTMMPLKPEPTPPIQQSGWNCVVDSEGTGWNCTLTGRDPSVPSDIDTADKKSDEFIPVHTDREMEVYNNMLERIPYDPWASCTSLLGPAISSDLGVQRDLAPISIESDYVDVFEEEILSFSGGVDFTRADQNVMADQTEYDLQSNTLNARGNVYFREEGLSLYSDSTFLKLASDKAHLTNTQYLFNAIPARGQADVVYKDSNTLYRLKNASYTTCRPNNQDWALYADDIKLDGESGVAEALGAVLKVRDVPVLYTPYISFPIDDRRKSGFLAPSIGSTEETGFDMTVPYYWNIAPNLDLTFSPRVMSKRGVLLGGELRYLTQASNTEFSAELVPYDSERRDIRGQASLIHYTRFSQNLSFDIDGNYVSDDDYLDELGNTLSVSDQRHVKSQANVLYRTEDTLMLARTEYYQTIDRTINSDDRPYRRLPQLALDTRKPIGNTGTEVNLNSEFVYFDRGNSVTGPRLNINPGLSYTFETPSMYIKPKISVDHTQYWLDDPTDTFSNVNRTLPIASIDSGVFLERDVVLNSSPYIQTLEPRAFYLYIPDHNQNDIPIFDTSEFDFNYNQLFRDNRFNGIDRIGDANQFSLALTSRFIDSSTGKERLKATVGQIYYFSEQNVTESPNTPRPTTNLSNLITELDAVIIDGLTFRSGLQWNPDVNDIARGDATVEYREGLDRILNLSYRYRRDLTAEERLIDQGDVSFRWPLLDDIRVVGRLQYSFLDDQTVESFLGFEKEGCCWRLRVLGRHYVNDVDSEAQTGIFFQVEFKGFTSFGDQVDKFLERNISGYRIP